MSDSEAKRVSELKLPSNKSFSYSKALKCQNKLQNLLEHGANSLMRDWQLIVEGEFSFEKDCDFCSSELPMSMGLTKNWIVIASQQRSFTSAKQSENSFPFCRKAVRTTGVFITLEQIVPRTFWTLAVDGDVLKVNNCCGQFHDYKFKDNEKIKPWKAEIKNFESSLTNEKINKTLKIFDDWSATNRTSLLIAEDEGGLKYNHVCKGEECFEVVSDRPGVKRGEDDSERKRSNSVDRFRSAAKSVTNINRVKSILKTTKKSEIPNAPGPPPPLTGAMKQQMSSYLEKRSDYYSGGDANDPARVPRNSKSESRRRHSRSSVTSSPKSNKSGRSMLLDEIRSGKQLRSPRSHERSSVINNPRGSPTHRDKHSRTSTTSSSKRQSRSSRSSIIVRSKIH